MRLSLLVEYHEGMIFALPQLEGTRESWRGHRRSTIEVLFVFVLIEASRTEQIRATRSRDIPGRDYLYDERDLSKWVNRSLQRHIH